jgi:SAM-dependent methyltransferase
MTKKPTIFSPKLKEFLDLTEQVVQINRQDVEKAIAGAEKRFHKATLTQSDINDTKIYDDIIDQWYNSLKTNPDYSVYSLPNYIIDLWMCWKYSSRPTIMKLHRKPTGISAAESFGKINKIVDLGSGIGYTSALLRSYWPDAEIIGTNIPGTFQYKIAEVLGKQHNFSMVEKLEDVGNDNDIVFASEYFEHFQSPIEHLEEVITTLKPKFLITANAFTYDAIGHFDEYLVDGKPIEDKKMNKLFTKKANELGYTRYHMKMFNDRPVIWVRNGT